MGDDALTPCAACGTPVKPGALFCGKCGMSITPAAAPDALNVPKSDAAVEASPPCWSCGNVLKPGARFCPACGASRDADRVVERDPASRRSVRVPDVRTLLKTTSPKTTTLLMGRQHDPQV